mmetsp:Transcript_67255/g.132663  ORF Transcript_67255/g.132663 Transcript_67255/m.132663 type:complete len:87 (-) Transcript_67255:79-339(-)
MIKQQCRLHHQLGRPEKFQQLLKMLHQFQILGNQHGDPHADRGKNASISKWFLHCGVENHNEEIACKKMAYAAVFARQHNYTRYNQ